MTGNMVKPALTPLQRIERGLKRSQHRTESTDPLDGEPDIQDDPVDEDLDHALPKHFTTKGGQRVQDTH